MFVNYNMNTNEITCDGVKIIGIRNEPIALSNVTVTVGKLDEQIFIHYNHSICKVIIKFKLKNIHNIIYYSVKTLLVLVYYVRNLII